jgi:hypothetical protein
VYWRVLEMERLDPVKVVKLLLSIVGGGKR